MKLIKPSYEVFKRRKYTEGIKLAATTYYTDLNKIVKDSIENVISTLITEKHIPILEHGTVYLQIPTYEEGFYLIDATGPQLSKKDFKAWIMLEHLSRDPYCKINNWESHYYVTTNYRTIVENRLEYLLKYQSPCYSPHYERVSVKFICSKEIARELMQYRSFSFVQESIQSNHYNNELTFIQPAWLDETYIPDLALETAKSAEARSFYTDLENAEAGYFNLLSKGWTSQQAQILLPGATKTELVMTGFESDWKGFFKTDNSQIQEFISPLRKEIGI